MDTEFETLLNGQQLKRLYEKMGAAIAEKYGLHKIEIEIMLLLKNGKCDTAREIADIKYFSKAHISRAIEHLTECGYLLGNADEQDRRCIHLHLTREAEPVCEEVAQLQNSILDIIYKNVTAQERQVLRNIARKIADNIKEELLTEP